MTLTSRRVALLVLFVLVALAGLALALTPRFVEDAVRGSLAGLPAVLAPHGIALDAPEVEKVSFSLASRELTLADLRLHGKLLARDGRTSVGSFLSSADNLSLRLTWRGLLLATPLGPLLLPGAQGAPTLVPVAELLEGREITTSLAEEGLALTVSAVRSTAADLAVDGVLLRALLGGEAIHDPLDWLYGFGVAELRLEAPALSLDVPATGESMTASCAETLTHGLDRRHMASQTARDIRCTLPDGHGFSIAELTQEAVALPEKALLGPLMQELAKAQLSEAGLERALKTALSGPEPLVGKGALSGLVVPLNQNGEALRLKRGAFTWRAVSPLDQEVVIERLSLPTAALTQEVGIVLAGLPTLSLDAELAVRATGPGASAPEQHKGRITAASLATLGYGFTLDPQGYGAELAALRGTYAGASLTYTDEGLLPRLAVSVMPSAEAAMMAIKVGLSRFCAAPTPENASLRAALETFVERPGTLTLTARKPFNLVEALVTVGEGDAGALIEASAKPGPLSLGEAMRRVEGR